MGFSDSLFQAIDEIFQGIGRYQLQCEDSDREELIEALVILRKIQYKYDGLNTVQFTNEQWRKFIERLYNRALSCEYGFDYGVEGEDFYNGVNIHDE